MRSLPLYRELLEPLELHAHRRDRRRARRVREVVDDRLAWARAQGLEIENEPQEWPYIPGYYAGFFHDPDGLKLEIVHVPARSPGRPRYAR